MVSSVLSLVSLSNKRTGFVCLFQTVATSIQSEPLQQPARFSFPPKSYSKME